MRAPFAAPGLHRYCRSGIRRDLEASLPTLHLVGRNGMHKYNNQDHAMMTAMLTARNILAGKRLYDVWDVNEDTEYHEASSSGVREALRSERLVPRQVEIAHRGLNPDQVKQL
jgi:protoporphyrinogen oxidase